MTRLMLLLGLLLASPLLCSPAEASRVSPMILELKPSGQDSIARVQLTNDGSRDIPYEVQMMRGIISPEGELELIPADEDFLVFPAQALVEQKSQQVFRIQYVGEEALAQSEIYYMSIRQVPVAYEPGSTQIQVVVNFNVLANVVPQNSQPIVVVRSAQVVERTVVKESLAEDGTTSKDEQTIKGLEVDVANDGNRYFLAGLSNWKIRGTTTEGAPVELDFKNDEASRVIGVGVVGPGRNRVFLIPMAEDLVPDSMSVEISP